LPRSGPGISQPAQAPGSAGVSPAPGAAFADAIVQASVQYALKRGIEAHFQLEDVELAAEPLPGEDDRRQMLFYEAAEGGAGVLARLASEPGALAAVARRALGICHFDEDGNEVGRADGRCEAACYDCLLSYSNQRAHRILDRQAARPVLLELARATGQAGAGGMTRTEQYVRLLGHCDSELERRFLTYLYRHGHRLPDEAQKALDGARPDFFYLDTQACIYVDGPLHQYPERAARDTLVRDKLERTGFLVVRVDQDGSWPATVAGWGLVFGEGDGE
jgi:very-short-patch-repair endonuclease